VAAVIHIIVEVLRGLDYARGVAMPDGIRGIVYCDMSPHNVMPSRRCEDRRVRDRKARTASNVTSTEMLKGKPAYMTPEQANGEPLDGRSDLFAVGVMLWEMLCGRSLFHGASTQETLARMRFTPIPSPRQLRGDIPEDVEQVTMRLLARELPARYPTAAEAMRDLIACSDHPCSGRELIGDLLQGRTPREAPTPEIATTARTAMDARLRLPAPNEAACPRSSWGRSEGSSRTLALLLFAVAALGAAIAMFVASRVKSDVPIALGVTVDASTPIVATTADAAVSRPIDAGGVVVERGEKPRERSRTRPTTESPPPVAAAPTASTDFDRDLAEIAKLGSVIDISKFLNPDDANADPEVSSTGSARRRCSGAATRPACRRCDASRTTSNGCMASRRSRTRLIAPASSRACAPRRSSTRRPSTASTRRWSGSPGFQRPPRGLRRSAKIMMITCVEACQLDDKAGKPRGGTARPRPHPGSTSGSERRAMLPA
jgi:hypothetical protein